MKTPAKPRPGGRTGALQGAARVRRLLKRLPDSVGEEMLRVMRGVQPMALAIAKVNTPVRTGRLRNAIEAKIYPRNLRFRIGLLRQKLARDLFYGRILEGGRKAKTVQVKRRTPSGGVTSYALRVSPISPTRYDFIYGRAGRSIRQLFRAPLHGVFDRALRAAAAGGD